jgi:hypothetical protein
VKLLLDERGIVTENIADFVAVELQWRADKLARTAG